MRVLADLVNLSAVWAWLGANGISTLAAIYLASLLCLLVLGICVYLQSRRHVRLAGSFTARITTIERLVRSADERLGALTGLIEQVAMANRVAEDRREMITDTENHGPHSTPDAISRAPVQAPGLELLPTIRGELERLIAELGVDAHAGIQAAGMESPEAAESAQAGPAIDPHEAPGTEDVGGAR